MTRTDHDAAVTEARAIEAIHRLAAAKRRAAEVEEVWRCCRDELEAARADIEYLTTLCLDTLEENAELTALARRKA